MSISTAFNRAFSKRMSVADLDRVMDMMIGGGPQTWSGNQVDENSALQNPTVWACTRVISEAYASMPQHMFRRTGNGGKEIARNHYLYPVLHDQTNPELTAFNYREMAQAHLCTWGNHFSLIEWDNAQRVKALWPLPPDRVRVKREKVTDPRTYQYRQNSGEWTTIQSEFMFHVPGLGYDGVIGYSPIGMQRQIIGASNAVLESSARLFGNGVRSSGFIEHPGSLTKESAERLAKSFSEQYAGLKNSHRVILLEGGLKFTPSSINPDDAQFLETRKFSRSEIAGMFRVPAHMVGDLEKATFCLPAGTLVSTPYGPVAIENVVVGDKVWSLDQTSGMVVQSKVKRSGCTGEDEILTIRTSNRTLRANGRHRILVRRKLSAPRAGQGGYQGVDWKNEFVLASGLKVGDTIVSLSSLPPDGKTSVSGRGLSVGFMEFCGLLLGDGNINAKVGVTIARAESALYMDYYRDVMRAEFVSYDGGNGRGPEDRKKTRSVTIREGERQTRFSSVMAADELTSLGLSGTAHTKSIPGWVFGLTESLRLSFLRGFLDADGSTDKLGRVSFSSCNERMLSQVRHLCISCAIPVTNLRCQRGSTTLPNGKRVKIAQWNFTCSDPGSNLRIGSHDPRYTKRMSQGRPFGRKGRNYPRHGGVGFDIEGFSLSRITSIAKGPEEPVFDLEVEGTHTFIADGVVVHNSNIEQQSLEFVTYTLVPWMARWEAWIESRLLTPQGRATYFVEIDANGLMRGDSAARAAYYQSAINAGWMKPNEARSKENLNEEPAGNVYIRPLNTAFVDASGTQVMVTEKPVTMTETKPAEAPAA